MYIFTTSFSPNAVTCHIVIIFMYVWMSFFDTCVYIKFQYYLFVVRYRPYKRESVHYPVNILKNCIESQGPYTNNPKVYAALFEDIF